jgi:dynein heavy chain
LDYCLPPGSNDLSKPVLRDTMAQHIEELPLENAPDVFGLHPNAETGYLRSATEMLWENLIELMPRGGAGAGGGGGKEDTLMKLTEEILTKIPAPFDRSQIMKSELDKAYAAKHENLQPTQVVLLQELERWNNLVNRMVLTIKNLQKALLGIVGMSADLDELASALSNGQLPSAWRRLAPSTRKNLGRWLVHFQQRYEQFRHWVEVGEPIVMWLAGLMVPESYVSALVQITCRKYVWPLDRSTVFTRVTKFISADEIKGPPKDGAYVQGLFLEGAKWDVERGVLAPQEKKILIYELPILEIIPQEVSKLKLVGTFRTPLYVTRDRRNAAGVGLVMECDLSSDKHPSHWILESVALILNSDD